MCRRSPASIRGTAAEKLTRAPKNNEPFAALAFKIAMDEGRKVVFMRIFSRHDRAGPRCSTSANKKEKVARLFRIHANKRERLDKGYAGEIVAAAGLKEATTATRCAIRSRLLEAGRGDDLAGIALVEALALGGCGTAPRADVEHLVAPACDQCPLNTRMNLDLVAASIAILGTRARQKTARCSWRANVLRRVPRIEP